MSGSKKRNGSLHLINRAVRVRYFIILLLFISSCGTTSHIVFFDFNTNKSIVEIELMKVIGNDSTFVVPKKWQSHTDGDYFQRFCVYFKNDPEEMYQIGFTGDCASWANSSTCRLGLIAIYQGDHFQYE